MFSLSAPELVYLYETTCPVYNEKKVYFLPIGEDLLSQISADPVHGLKVSQGYSQPRGPGLALGGFNLQAPGARLNMVIYIFPDGGPDIVNPGPLKDSSTLPTRLMKFLKDKGSIRCWRKITTSASGNISNFGHSPPIL